MVKQSLFHEAGIKFWERALFAGNQYGKSFAGAAEVAIHAIGLYDSLSFEWEGRRFNGDIDILIIGSKLTQMRDSCQRLLMGTPDVWGDGLIPKESIIGSPKMSKETNGCIDYVRIARANGYSTTITFKSQTQGSKAIMGSKKHVVWWDEMPEDTTMYSQSIARLTITEGSLITTATPEDGYTEIMAKFMDDPKCKDRWHVFANVYENVYLSKEHVQNLEKSYSPNERRMRIEGLPIFGAGPVYPFTDDEIGVDNFRIPDHWPHISAIDLGWKTSKTAVIWGAIDPYENGDQNECTLYIYDLINKLESTPAAVAPSIKRRDALVGYDIPMAWPKDANQPERTTGAIAAKKYRQLGVNLISKPAMTRGIDGKYTFSIQDGVDSVYTRMDHGKLKIIRTPRLQPLWDELKTYSYEEKDGAIKNKNRYDNLDALRYMVACLRFAYEGTTAGRNGNTIGYETSFKSNFWN